MPFQRESKNIIRYITIFKKYHIYNLIIVYTDIINPTVIKSTMFYSAMIVQEVT